MDTITFNPVRENGNISLERSLEAAEAALVKYIAETETQESVLADAVNAVFDQFPGKPMAMPTLVSLAVAHLNGQPENFKVLSEKVAQYVRDHSQGKNLAEKGKTPVWENPGSLFIVAKGYGGGVSRRETTVARPTESSLEIEDSDEDSSDDSEELDA